ncbi:MAG: hypothetical protein F6K42_12865 [Leptolyngbya sp. SIO1D8]|nr:hypothetical protein [Leptolyngbya sp. SIO1D8]
MVTKAQRPLDLGCSYPCPVCRHGDIQALVLTDAFSCDFCRHILSVDLKRQQVQVVDGPQAISWVWDGQRWRLANGTRDQDVNGLVIIAALFLIVFPASLVWLAGFIFPPLTPSSKIAFSTIWALLTFLAHLGLVLWLVGEYYQIPFYVATKVRLFRQRSSENL